MSSITLKDILIGARQESYRMRHFYVGAEHLFIALLDIQGSITANIIQEHGLTPEYVIDAIRRRVGKGSRHRLWAGIPNTPRTEVLLSIAHDLALEHGRAEIIEHDLLVAVFEEHDSIPVRVLQALGLEDIDKLAEMSRNYTPNSDSQRPYVRLDFGPDFDRSDELSKEQLFILRRMFYGYNQIRIDRRLTGGYSNATLLVVTPIHADTLKDAPVVVKIDHVDTILDEAQRYENHVKSKLPAMTARLEDKPVAPETSDLAGIKYTLVAGYDQAPQDLRAILGKWDSERLGNWIENELFPTFGRIWWQQNRPYRFQAWREYDWLLPPILTLESLSGKPTPPEGHTLRIPMKRTRLHGMEYGEMVAVENFIVQKVYPEQQTIQLAAGHGTEAAKAYKIEVRGVDLRADTYYRGEVVERIVGRIWKTRHEQLVHAVRALEPDFDPEAEKISTGIDSPEKLPNPVLAYEALLDSYVNGTLSTIHGDLHPGNIMIGPNQSAFLIDFAHTRDGHTVFDWAMLETSLLSDLIMPAAGESWDSARDVLHQLILLNGDPTQISLQSSIGEALRAIVHIRRVVQGCLATANNWSEYFTALAFCALRAVTWETMPITSRRLMFLTSALAIHELRTRFRPTSEGETPSPEETDLNST